MSIDSSDIFRAVMDGNSGIMSSLLAEDPQKALAKDADSRTPLHWAVSFQNIELVKLLLDPSKLSSDSNTKKIVVDIDDYLDDSLWNPFHIACATGNLEVVQLLATHNPIPDVDAQTSTGQTPLHYAVSKNHFPVVEFLLKDMKASARIKDKKNQLPIHRAAGIGSAKMIQILVEVGKSQLNVLDSFGMSAMHHALAEGHADIALQLVKYGADWKQVTSDGETPLKVALNDNVRSFFKKGLVEEGLLEEQ